MSEFILDLTEYRDTRGARVDEGDYEVIVDDAELTKSKAGNQMVNIWLRIVGTEFDGLIITDRLTITKAAMFRVVGFMQAIGMKTPKAKFKLSTARFVGKRLVVSVSDGDPYNGSIKSEVRGYMRPSKKGQPDGGTAAGADEEALFADDGDEDLLDGEDIAEEELDMEDDVVEEEPEPEPAPAPRKRRAAPAKAKPAPEPEPEEDDGDDLDLDEVDLEDLDLD